MKFFEVTAKCGHVGKQNYFMGIFYERTESATEAARTTRTRARVKHHHKDAILKVAEIDFATYRKGIAEKRKNPYYMCRSKQEQFQFNDVIEQNIFEEPMTIVPVIKKTETDKNVYHGKTKIRKPNKYVRMNQMLEFDYELPGA